MAGKVYVEGYNTLPDGRNVWLFQCSYDEVEDEGYSLLDGHFEKRGFKGDRVGQWGGGDWIRSTASLKRIREEFRPGDWMFMYQAKPNRSLVGIARLGKHRQRGRIRTN